MPSSDLSSVDLPFLSNNPATARSKAKVGSGSIKPVFDLLQSEIGFWIFDEIVKGDVVEISKEELEKVRDARFIKWFKNYVAKHNEEIDQHIIEISYGPRRVYQEDVSTSITSTQSEEVDLTELVSGDYEEVNLSIEDEEDDIDKDEDEEYDMEGEDNENDDEDEYDYEEEDEDKDEDEDHVEHDDCETYNDDRTMVKRKQSKSRPRSSYATGSMAVLTSSQVCDDISIPQQVEMQMRNRQDQEAIELNRDVTFLEVFNHTHKRLGDHGDFIDNKSKSTSPEFDPHAWTEAIGGKETTCTHVYGFGTRVPATTLLTRTQSNVPTSESACGPINSNFNSLANALEEKVKNLAQNLNKIREKIREEIHEEMRNVMAEGMSEFMARMETMFMSNARSTLGDARSSRLDK
ncbi:Uncharacterized protein TCM_010747 [Theobroma cacao]|uniref:Uncharacterized protein n=1 Tax=Theobroma cacao TaxID=3641 RepID=A0A061E772_THECC|nr:Uncharacterized protein TCM_010747 [Theobroma cacao]